MTLLYKLLVVLSVVVLSATASAAQSHEIARGRSLYLEHCAVCHGRTGDGRGPMASVLSTPPTNLRHLAERYGNPLPTDQIARFIDGRADVRAHGPRDMPVWGGSVWQRGPGKQETGQVTAAIASLVTYLQSIQLSTHPVAAADSSAQWSICSRLDISVQACRKALPKRADTVEDNFSHWIA
jgi:mono/diheme cytochrome c family protein